MKRFTWVSLVMAIGCGDKADMLTPNQLTGTTWKAIKPEGKSWNRWTFHNNYLYVSNDSIATCQPVQQGHAILWTYITERRAIITTFAGPSASWTATQVRWSTLVRSYPFNSYQFAKRTFGA